MEVGFLFALMKMVLKLDYSDLHNFENISYNIELYTSNRLTMWYVNYISIELLNKTKV